MVDRSPAGPVNHGSDGSGGDDQPGENRRSSDEIEISTLIVDHHVVLYRYAFRLAGNQDDAEDLVQQTFMIAQQKLHQLREPSKVRNWLYTILRTCFLKSQRKQSPVPAAMLELNVNDIPQNNENDENIDGERLQLAINELADEFRVVVLMYYFEECSYREIAEKLELPIGTVMSRLSRAKGHLRAILLAAESNTG